MDEQYRSRYLSVETLIGSSPWASSASISSGPSKFHHYHRPMSTSRIPSLSWSSGSVPAAINRSINRKYHRYHHQGHSNRCSIIVVFLVWFFNSTSGFRQARIADMSLITPEETPGSVHIMSNNEGGRGGNWLNQQSTLTGYAPWGTSRNQ